MTPEVNRRDFLNALGVTMGGTLAAATGAISFAGVAHAQLAGRSHGLLGSRQKRLVNSGDQDITIDALFAFPKFQDG